MSADRLQVLIIDDHLAVRRGLELLLLQDGFAIAGGADHPSAAGSQLRHGHYDVAMLEIRRRGGDGLELARQVLRTRDQMPLVLYTGATEPRGPLVAASRLGAPGFVLTGSPPETLTAALTAVAGGGSYIDPELAELLSAGPAARRLDVLTRRELQVLGLLADGESGPEIAEQLFLSLETVRTHIRNAITKLGARTRVQAAAMVAAARVESAGGPP
jgi:DNA-binding NarL/FixJ family response regulator